MPPLLTTEINMDDVITLLAYVDARSGIDGSVLGDALEILTEDKGKWDLNFLAAQVRERSAVIQGAL